MMTSIVLPNLNTPLEFLKVRLKSFLDQVHSDWECIVVDGYSSNGSWEYLQSVASGDSRFRLIRTPAVGIYNAWNIGIKESKGENVYIAPSDDTMHPMFLEKLTHALNNYPEADIAHCCLEIINSDGVALPINDWRNFPAPRFFGALVDKVHIRHAPHDGILHAFVKTVYQSITQLLVRRRVFDELGLFLESAGPIADYEWGLRVSLFKNIVHVPEILAAWRIHPEQATQQFTQEDPKTYDKLVKWVSTNVMTYLETDTENKFNISLAQLLDVYRHNQRYFTVRKRCPNQFLFKVLRRLFPDTLTYQNGLAEAVTYFKVHRLTDLIKIVP